MKKRLRFIFVHLSALFIVWTGTLPSLASSHREAPLIIADPLADNTDVYAFRSTESGRDGFVTLIANWIPFEEPAGGPHFYKFDDTVVYSIKVDNTGDGVADITYEFRFTNRYPNPDTVLGMATGPITSLTDPDYTEPQVYSVTRVDSSGSTLLADGLITPPCNIGSRTTPNYETALAQPAIYSLTGGGRVFAGQRDEGFYINIEGVFDTLNLPVTETGGTDGTSGFNVNSIAIEVPVQSLTRGGTVPSDSTANNAVIGVWATSSRLSLRTFNFNNGNLTVPSTRQVSRLGNPLVNEVVIPLGRKDSFNASEPKDDAQFAPFVVDPQLAKLLNAVFGLAVPPAPRNDLVAIFATGIQAGTVPGAPTFTTFLSDGNPHEMMRLNVAIPPTAAGSRSRLGLLGGDPAGFPNGRRVGDDVTDIELRAVAGGTPFTPQFNVAPNNALGDGVPQNDVPYLERFPYLGTPHAGNVDGKSKPHEHHKQN
ncbi:MAG: DUF4331 domain-containing protein [Blastocatellia bacterium]